MAHTEPRDYIVVLKSASDKAGFIDMMCSDSSMPHVPDRQVRCSNDRNMNDRQVHFMLTALEAVRLANDSRVESVELSIHHNPVRNLVPTAYQPGLFDANDTIDTTMTNWGLYRHITQQLPFSNPAEQGLNAYRSNNTYTWSIAGDGADVIIVDTGVAAGHPEFAVNADGTGGSRVVDYDWTILGVKGVVPLAGGSGINGFLGDSGGHGTHVASIVAGNSFGWARKARIFSIRAVPSSANDIETGTPLTSFIDINLVYDLIKQFHKTKPIDPYTGWRRPTVVLNSWAIVGNYTTPEPISNTHYRGYTYITSARDPNLGQVNDYFVDASPSIDASIADAMAAGVIVVSSGGDFGMKIDLPGGRDYDNSWYDNDMCENHYYHRGGTPCASTGQGYRVITVGALDGTADYTDTNNPKENKAFNSNSGPGVTIWAAGTNVMGAHAPEHGVGDPRVPECGCEHEYYLGKLSGSSVAAAQVAGVITMLAGIRPSLEQNQATQWLIANATKNTMFDNHWLNDTNWLDTKFLNGASQRILYMPYNGPIALKMNGAFKMKGPMRAYTQPSGIRKDVSVLPTKPNANNVTTTVLYNSTNNIISSSTNNGATAVNVNTYPSHGTVTANGLNFTYTPTPGYYGPDSFTYTASNAGGTSNVATVNITVVKPTPVTPPVFTKATLDSGYFYNAGTFRLNMTWATQNTAYVTIDGDPTHYGANASAGISITQNTSGQYWQKLTAHGFDGTTTTTQVPYYVNGAIAPVTKPVAGSTTAVVPYNSAGNTIHTTVSGVGVNGLAIATPPTNGSATAGASLTYTPNPGFSGSDSFTYTASNAAGNSDPGTVNITVQPPAIQVSDITVDCPFNTNGVAVFPKMTNGVGSTVYHALTQPQHGTITPLSVGFKYVPTKNYIGPDSFTYTVSDSRGQSSPATATINVASPGPPSFISATGSNAQPLANTNFLRVGVVYSTKNTTSVTFETPGLRSGVAPYAPVSSLNGPPAAAVYLIVDKPSSPGTYPVTITAIGLDGTKTTATANYTVT